ncbi:MAG: HAMP domain-containing histidine kinase [Balneolales bacterium]|nr:HAMP domain-containing histidine kinase [Balneolales bacterium]
MQEKQKHLEQLNKEKDDVLAVISHDMRNPLGGIIGIVDLMRSEQITDTDELDEMLSLIDSSAQRLLHLVNDMLDVAVIESNRLKIDRSETNIEQLIHDVVQTHEPAAKHKSVELIIEIDNSLKFATIDKSKIAQVLGNLVSNAIKFTQTQGSVTIQAGWSDEFDGFIVMKVSDTGIGIPQSMMSVLFEKMGNHQRAGTQGEKGTGLGMPIIKRYVEAHGGVVDVESREGMGTKFIITIPATIPK